MRLFFAIITSFFILTACSSQPQVTVTPFAEVTVILPLTTTPLPTLTPEPTDTPFPTATALIETTEAAAPTMTLLNELGVTVGTDGIVELKMDGDTVVIIEKSTGEEVGRDGLLTLDFMHEALSRSGLVGGIQEPANPRSSRINQPAIYSPVIQYGYDLKAQYREEYIKKFEVDPNGGSKENGRLELLLVRDNHWIVVAGSVKDGKVVFDNVTFRTKNNEQVIKWFPIQPTAPNEIDRVWMDNPDPS